jgi:hypothetical protein
MNLLQQFPYVARREKILSNKSFWWHLKKWVFKQVSRFVGALCIIGGFILAAFVILVLMGLLRACGVKEL